MRYKGYKIRIRCIEWEQVKTIDKFWNVVTEKIAHKEVIGLGFNWSDDYLYFDYAIGTIDNYNILKSLKSIDFSRLGIEPIYFEIDLPNKEEFKTFKGKDKDIKTIYEKYIDCCNKQYDYELEYIDGYGNIEIKIHFIES